MQEKNDTVIITDLELLSLLELAKQNDPEAILQIIEVFRKDILRVSKFIYLPEEDAISEIILEFLEFIHKINL